MVLCPPLYLLWGDINIDSRNFEFWPSFAGRVCSLWCWNGLVVVIVFLRNPPLLNGQVHWAGGVSKSDWVSLWSSLYEWIWLKYGSHRGIHWFIAHSVFFLIYLFLHNIATRVALFYCLIFPFVKQCHGTLDHILNSTKSNQFDAITMLLSPAK